MKRSTARKIGGTRRAQGAIPREKRKTEEEKEEAAYRRSEQRARAAQLAEKCSACGKAGKIPYSGVPDLSSPPPLWLVENPWLVDDEPLCPDCIEAGARVPLCFEGGSLHQFWEVAGRTVCLDCGWDDEREPGILEEDFVMGAFECARLKGTIRARAGEIEELTEWLDLLTERERKITAQRIKLLCADLRWRERRVAEESIYAYRPKDGVGH